MNSGGGGSSRQLWRSWTHELLAAISLVRLFHSSLLPALLSLRPGAIELGLCRRDLC